MERVKAKGISIIRLYKHDKDEQTANNQCDYHKL